MFEFLDEVTAENVIPAGHHAIQFIRQWAAGSAAAGRPLRFEGLPPLQLELARRIVTEIETREGQAVLALPQLKIQEYIRAVADRLQDLSRRDLKADAKQGKALLEKLRLVK